VAGTLLFPILLFFLPLLLKFAHRPWPFFDDINKVLFPGFNVKIGCVNLLILILILIRRKKITLTVKQTLSRSFSLDELETALMSVKPGKAAGFDGIYPAFIKNFGAQTKEWIISFMNDIVSTSKIPNLFKRAKVNYNIKPEKTVLILYMIVQYRFLM
jgi:hypothetical protein